jgi:hypothetical protein
MRLTFGTDLDVVERFFLKYTGTAPVGTDMATFAGTVITAWTAHLQGLHISDVELVNVDCEDLTSSTGAVGSSVAAVSGTLAGNTLPAGTAFLLNKKIARRYRGGKPRSYLPVGGDSQLSNAQQWTSGFVTSVETDWPLFIAAIAAAPWAGATINYEVNVSFYSGSTVYITPTGRAKNISKVRVGNAVVDEIIGYLGSESFASQRRRNRP